MKILIYSDIHISRTSSILPTVSEFAEYTYRQQMIIQTAEWLANIIKQEQPDLVVNLGDTFDQHTITSHDIQTASIFFKKIQEATVTYTKTQTGSKTREDGLCDVEFRIDIDKIIPHYILCGNHEMLSERYNALQLLNNIEGIKVIDTITTIDNMTFIPYCDYKTLDISKMNGELLFLHNDVYGSKVRDDYSLDFGLALEDLKNFKQIFNGHVHANSIFGNVVNVGSAVTHSFADSETSKPKCFIYENGGLKAYTNKHCPLFKKVEIKEKEDLEEYVSKLEDSFKYILHIVCPYEIREEIKSYLEMDKSKIINSKITTKVTKHKINYEEETDVKDEPLDTVNMVKSFITFMNEDVELKYPTQVYIDVLERIN